MRWMALVLTAWAVVTAQAKDFSSWRKYTEGQLIPETQGFAPGNLGTVGFKIKLESPWHTYWVNPGDSGTPVRLHFHPSRGVQVKRVLFPYPQREVSGPLTSFNYENLVLLPIELQFATSLRPGDSAALTVDAEWLVCAEVCIPAFQTFSLALPIVPLTDVKPADEFALFQKTRAALPTEIDKAPRFTVDASGIRLKPHVAEEFVEFFPFRSSGVNNTKPQLREGELVFEKGTVPQAASDRVGVLLTRAPDGGVRAYQYGNSGWEPEVAGESEAPALWWIWLSAFVGGLILNLMPCVFPILSIKLLSLLKLAHAQAGEVRRQNLAYVAGVLFSFAAIALLLAGLRSAGHLVGWGFQLQSPVFLSLLCWLFFALTLNLLGLFEFDIFNAGVGSKLARMGGISGSFFTGVLAVIVASPCTAPFMGVALGFGLSQPTLILLSVFMMLGLGLAFPYLLFVVFPGWVRLMPKPGRWMEIVKRIMAIPLFLTTLWLLWVLAQVRGPSDVAAVVVVGLLVGLALSVHKARRVLTAVAVAGIVVGIALMYRPTKINVEMAELNAQWKPYSDQTMASLKGQNIFVNMTADWCLTCKVNERLVFADQEVQDTLRKKSVVWLKGDWTQRNEEITSFLNRFDRVGVPFYVLYSARNPAGLALPEVLTKTSFLNYINQEFP